MRRVVRSSTRTPSARSRSATARLTAALGTPSARAAAEKPFRSMTFASMASWAGVQIRLIAASIGRELCRHCFIREARAPDPRGARIGAPDVASTRKDFAMKVSMYALSVEVFANTLNNLAWLLEKSREQRSAAQDRSRRLSRRAPRARHAAADPPGADRLRPGEELGIASCGQGAAALRGHRDHHRAAARAHRSHGGLPEELSRRTRSRRRTHATSRCRRASAHSNSRDWISCSAGRSRTSFFTSRRRTTFCVTTASNSARRDFINAGKEM